MTTWHSLARAVSVTVGILLVAAIATVGLGLDLGASLTLATGLTAGVYEYWVVKEDEHEGSH